jgi:hypothetical protein
MRMRDLSHRPRRGRATFVIAASLLAAAAVSRPSEGTRMDRTATEYVKLVLALGQHDPDYVDAYYGPPEWKAEAASGARTLDQIRSGAVALIDDLEGHPIPTDSVEAMRLRYQLGQLRALVARLDLVAGHKRPFDEESKALYDAVAPTDTEAHFREILDALERELPGGGPLSERYEAFRATFVIPPDRLDRVITAAISEARDRTRRRIALPEGESFTVEYVKDKPWGGYNWYQGGFRSVIQVNTDLPIHIDRAIDLAAHEGYPGHHVYNALLEDRLVKRRGFVELTVYPLFSPQSLIAEGSANFGIAVAFPADERLRFESEVLFPLAGLDPSRAERYARVSGLVDQLGYAGNEAARRYLDGRIDREDAMAWLTRFALMSPARAAQRLRFFDTYRSYVINYNLGKDLVRHWVEARGGTDDQPQRRWAVFEELLSSPRLPSDLVEGR